MDLLPGLDELSTLELAEASKRGIGVVPSPASAGTAHPMLDDAVAATPHRSTANRIGPSPKLIVPHASQARLEVARRLADLVGYLMLIKILASLATALVSSPILLNDALVGTTLDTP